MANPIVKIHILGADPIVCELYPDKAPLTVQNFIDLAEAGFYDRLIFHRVIKGFVIQGGGYDEEFQPREIATKVKGEFSENGWDKNDISHLRGVLSMARARRPDSANSQFFIMHGDCPELDGHYAAFGRVIEGMDTVDLIASQPTERFGADHDVPLTLCVIEGVEVCRDEKDGE